MDLLVFVRKTMMSSVYKAKQCAIYPMVIPEILLCDLTTIAKGLFGIMNNNGYKVSACLIPRFVFKVFEILIKICAHGS